jgi:hypothetical protein
MSNGNCKTRVLQAIEVNTRSLGGLGMTVFCEGLSSYVCKRRPKLIVILRPPKDLAVLPCINKGICHVNHPIIVIPRPPRDLVFVIVSVA